jgi:glycosyltransferase involved in cell wall biosynthesis
MEMPLVTIACPAYNHEEFIKQTIESFLMQKTTFKYEILIHDDASTDNTPNIIKEYAALYPNIIKLVIQTVNQHSRGVKNAKIILPLIKTKYIALCEGDDYWTDPYKLQKQVDFLEANPDMSLCAHNASILDNHTFRKAHFVEHVTDLTKKELISHNPIMTASVVFRNGLIDLPKWMGEIPFGDYGLYFLAITKGRIGVLPDDMSVYRIHNGGIHSVLHNKRAGMIKVWDDHIRFYKVIKNKLVGLNAEDIVELNKTLLKCYSNLLSEYKTQDKKIKYYVLKVKLYLSVKFNLQFSNL